MNKLLTIILALSFPVVAICQDTSYVSPKFYIATSNDYTMPSHVRIYNHWQGVEQKRFVVMDSATNWYAAVLEDDTCLTVIDSAATIRILIKCIQIEMKEKWKQYERWLQCENKYQEHPRKSLIYLNGNGRNTTNAGFIGMGVEKKPNKFKGKFIGRASAYLTTNR